MLKLQSKVVALAILSAGVVLTAGTVMTHDVAYSGSQCAARCYAQEKACMQRTKGAQRCDADLTRCLQQCRARR